MFQVHSLTARSVSRQFREGLKLSKPAITTNNVKVNPADNINNSSYTVQSQNPKNPNTNTNTTNTIKSDFVADKAKYWDERVRLANDENNM